VCLALINDLRRNSVSEIMPYIHNVHACRRGQAELVAATIAIAVFVIVIAYMFIAISSAGHVTTSALADRARFENEKQLEKLAYAYDPITGSCTIMNAGAVEIEIVRVWRPDGTVDTSSSLVNRVISPGQSLPIADWSSVAYIVTARGNVFPVQSRCLELERLSTMPQSGGSAGAPPVTSSDFVTRSDFLRLGGEYGILCSVSGSSTYASSCRVLYFNGSGWIVNNGTQWISPPRSVNLDPDLNNDSIYELVLADPSSGYGEIRFYGTINANITFVNVTEITPDVDTIYVYYEFVLSISGSGNPHQSPLAVSVVLSNRTTALEFPSTFAWFASTRSSVAVIQGSTVIPIRAYESLQQSIANGVYNLTLKLTYYPDPNVKVTINFVRLQKFAISGAKIVWQKSIQ